MQNMRRRKYTHTHFERVHGDQKMKYKLRIS